ncbi:MAG TPA: glycosyltransferase [Solirubrobacterales bacterium]|nr:glycosyltransferase [Solirubrobacterales bacterium]
MTALEIVFWVAAGLLVYAQLGYPLVLAALAAVLGRRSQPAPELADDELPRVTLIVAAHDEEAVIGRRVRDALALGYPRDRLELIVASDGSVDRTAEVAGAAGADLVLDLPRGGKVAALNAAVERSSGEVLAFTDANSSWRPDALRRLVERLAEPGAGYVCGRLRLLGATGDNQEGLYWRYETAVRELESRLGGITAGNGAINAVRRDAYVFLEPVRGQDITLPFTLTKRGWRAVYEPRAIATEPMAATIGDELGRKRRMMTGAWATMLGGGMLSPRGYGPLYAFEIASHRLLRYATPFLHLIALGANLAILGQGPVYVATLAAQAALLAAAALAPLVPAAPLRIARYYVAVTAASAVGLWDYLRRGVPVTWEKAAGTREA